MFYFSIKSPIQHINSNFSLLTSINSLQKLKLHLPIQVSNIRSSPLLQTYFAHAPSQCISEPKPNVFLGFSNSLQIEGPICEFGNPPLSVTDLGSIIPLRFSALVISSFTVKSLPQFSFLAKLLSRHSICITICFAKSEGDILFWEAYQIAYIIID